MDYRVLFAAVIFIYLCIYERSAISADMLSTDALSVKS